MNYGLTAEQRLGEADKKLNATYQRIIKQLPPDTQDNHPKGSLIAAEREWLKFRDAECSWVGEISGGVRMWKSAYQSNCLADKTEARSKELTDAFEPNGP